MGCPEVTPLDSVVQDIVAMFAWDLFLCEYRTLFKGYLRSTNPLDTTVDAHKGLSMWRHIEEHIQ